MPIDTTALDQAVRSAEQPLRVCQHLGLDHPNARTVVWFQMPHIVREYRRIIDQKQHPERYLVQGKLDPGSIRKQFEQTEYQAPGRYVRERHPDPNVAAFKWQIS